MMSRMEERPEERKAGINDEMLTEIRLAAQMILSGELVGFPTETVYGLGANALDMEAVKKIYESKRLSKDRAIEELLGAINYIAAGIIILEESD